MVDEEPGPHCPKQQAPPPVRTVDTGGGDYAESNIDKRQGSFINGGITQGPVIGVMSGGTINYQASQPARRERNLQAVLDKVEKIWIEGLLKQSLDPAVRVDLTLETRSALVQRPHLAALVQELDNDSHPLTSSKHICDIFDNSEQALLILGAPGSGKTMLLLELARDLVDRAHQNPDLPVPVVLNLSSWATRQRPLHVWLVEELYLAYGVPRKIGRTWLKHDLILPLLDGLDEVAVQHRGACAEAISTFRKEHGLLPIAICSRLAEYRALPQQLPLQKAVILQPLSEAQITTFLARGGLPLAGLQQALQQDSSLHELATAPLLLNVMALAFRDVPVSHLTSHDLIGDPSRHLFDVYVQRMLARRQDHSQYSNKQTLQLLHWLASQLLSHDQSSFYLENLQPSWLPPGSRLWLQFVTRILAVLVCLIVYAVVQSVGGSFLVGGFPWTKVAQGLAFESPFLICAALVGALLGFRSRIHRVDALRWAHPASRTRRTSALHGSWLFFMAFSLWLVPVLTLLGIFFNPGVGLDRAASPPLIHLLYAIVVYPAIAIVFSGLTFGVLGGIIGLVTTRPARALQIALAAAGIGAVLSILVLGSSFSLNMLLEGALGGSTGGLFGGVVGGVLASIEVSVDEHASLPNQGIRRSLHTSLMAGIGMSVVCVAIVLLGYLFSSIIALGPIGLAKLQPGLFFGLEVGPIIGLGTGLVFGGTAFLEHYVLRWFLITNRLTPRNYVGFLDFCTERILLRRIGGGYIFIHRMLLEYFASSNE